MDLADVGEEEEVIVRAGDEQPLDEVPLLGVGADDPLAPPTLLAVAGERHALDVSLVGDGDGDVLLGDEVLHVELLGLAGDLGAPGVAVAGFHLLHVVADEVVDEVVVGEDVAVVLDFFLELLVFGFDLFALEARQPGELHGEDGVGLEVAQLEALHQPVAGGVDVGTLLDDLDDLVDVVERDQEALDDVRPGLGPPQQEPRPTDDHLEPVLHERGEDLLEVERPAARP